MTRTITSAKDVTSIHFFRVQRCCRMIATRSCALQTSASSVKLKSISKPTNATLMFELTHLKLIKITYIHSFLYFSLSLPSSSILARFVATILLQWSNVFSPKSPCTSNATVCSRFPRMKLSSVVSKIGGGCYCCC